MSSQSLENHPASDSLSLSAEGWTNVLYAVVAAGVVYFLSVVSQSTDSGIPNSDDIMRLVVLRDMVGGQSWFDPVQYRLGLEAGTVMHWSRLVDAPLAGIYFISLFLTGSEIFSEQTVRYVWPALTLFTALYGLNVACVRIGKPDMRGPTTIIGAAALMTLGIFGVGALDHHNIQVALGIWLIALLLPGRNGVRAHAFAGAIAVFMLAIGMETLPYITLVGIWIAFRFFLGEVGTREAASFGLSLGLFSALVFALTVAPTAYGQVYCDSYSLFHVGMSGIGGFGLALTSYRAPTPTHRFLGLCLTGIVALAALVVVFPQCLSNPLSALDPKLREFWLDGVVETRSALDLWRTDPFQLVGLFGMALTGLLICLRFSRSEDFHARTLFRFSGLLLAVAVGVTIWQQRGMMFAAAFAVLPLGLFVTQLRQQYLATRTIGSLLKMFGMGLLSLNMFWWIAGANAANLFSEKATLQQQAASASAHDYCYSDRLYEPLTKYPAGVVLAATDVGAMTLKLTPHRVLAGPYHRNTDGNLAMIEIMLAQLDLARQMLQDAGVTLIVDCINSADAQEFKRAAPGGLQARLHKGDIPSWLEVVPQTVGGPMVIYRFVP